MVEQYLKLGWHIFPVQERGKAPLTPNGFKDASCDPKQIEEWQFSHVNPNWAWAPGMTRNLVVDLDIHKGGTREALETFLGKALPIAPEVKTGSGGTHLIYRVPDEVPVLPKTRLGFIKGVDILCRTGYSILPPSIHPNGQPYEWVRDPMDFCLLAPEVPDFLLTALKLEPERKVQEVFGEIPELQLTSGMGRWGYFQRFAGILRSLGWGSEAIKTALLGFYEEQCEPDPDLPRKIRDISEWVVSKPAINTLEPIGDETVMVSRGTEVRRIKKSKLPDVMAKGWYLK